MAGIVIGFKKNKKSVNIFDMSTYTVKGVFKFSVLNII